MTNLINEHNKFARLSLKLYSQSDLGITNSDDIVDLVNKTPNNSILEVWINDASVFGRNIRKELNNLYPNFFGYLKIRWSIDLNTCYFEACHYLTGRRFFKTYTKVNGENWGEWISL